MRKLKLAIRLIVLVSVFNISAYCFEENLLSKAFAYEIRFAYSSTAINGYKFRLLRLVYSIEYIYLFISDRKSVV